MTYDSRKLVDAMINDDSGILEEAMSAGTYDPGGSTDNIDFSGTDSIPADGPSVLNLEEENALNEVPWGSFKWMIGEELHGKAKDFFDNYGNLIIAGAGPVAGASLHNKIANSGGARKVYEKIVRKIFGRDAQKVLNKFKPGVNTNIHVNPRGVNNASLNIPKGTPSLPTKGFRKTVIGNRPPSLGGGSMRETTLPVKPSPSQMDAINKEFFRREMIKRKAYAENARREWTMPSLGTTVEGTKITQQAVKSASRLLPPALIASMLQEDDIFSGGGE